VLFNTTLHDMETGYKALRTSVIRSLDLREDRFGIEPEITAKVCSRKVRIFELPIAYYGRTYAEGKKVTWRDGARVVGARTRPDSRLTYHWVNTVVAAHTQGCRG
jgi:hypothetical protein